MAKKTKTTVRRFDMDMVPSDVKLMEEQESNFVAFKAKYPNSLGEDESLARWIFCHGWLRGGIAADLRWIEQMGKHEEQRKLRKHLN